MQMKYPNLPNKENVPLYTAKEMQHYAEDAVDMYKDAVDTYKDTYENTNLEVSKLKADVKVKDSTIRTLRVELLKYRNMDMSVDWSEVQRLRLRVQQLEKQNSDYGWQLNPDRMGQ